MTESDAGARVVRQIVGRLGDSPDFVRQTFRVGPERELTCLYLSSLASGEQVQERIVKPMIEAAREEGVLPGDLTVWVRSVVPLADSVWSEANDGIKKLLDGFCLLIVGDAETFLGFDVADVKHRSVSEPSSESSIRGPREGFVEDIDRNVGLIRKRLRNECLVFEPMRLGAETGTKVYLTYLSDAAAPDVVEAFRRRLAAVRADSVLESAYLEEQLQDNALSPFPQFVCTERPDSVAGKLLGGQVAVMTDGTPMAIVGPTTFFQLFSTPEDYYQRAGYATLIRWLRMFAFLLAIFVPALYIAVVSFHQELLPTPLLINLAAQRESVPFPAFIEAMLMIVTFEILREAGLRMPRLAGQAISIVGAIVIGQAAVEAGLVSAAMVIVVALTAIANYVSTSTNFGIAQRYLQFGFMISAGVLGLFGVMCGVFFVLIHLAALRSFGAPYLWPLAPVDVSAWKDTILRAPHVVIDTVRRAYPNK